MVATGTGTDATDFFSEGAATTDNPVPVGVFGSSSAADGVYGMSGTANFSGVFGTSTSPTGAGTSGFNTSGAAGSIGVYGESDEGYGVFGYATSGSGVVGEGTTGPGLQGFSTSQAGLTGVSSSNYGTFGTSSSGPGLGGFSTSSYGGYFETQTQSQYAAFINNTTATSTSNSAPGLVVNGNFVVVNGTKSAAVDVDGQLRLMYAIEAPQSLFEDVGRAQLVDGRAHVTFDPLFAKTIELGEYYVFLTPGSAKSEGLAVVARSLSGFSVEELHDGLGTYEFDYRVVAIRKGLTASQRLEPIERPAMPETVAAGLLTPPAPLPRDRPFKSATP